MNQGGTRDILKIGLLKVQQLGFLIFFYSRPFLISSAVGTVFTLRNSQDKAKLISAQTVFDCSVNH